MMASIGERNAFRTDGRRVQAPAAVQPRSVAGRVPVNDLDAEAATLAAVLLDETALPKVRPILPTAAAFYAPANQRVYEAALAVADRGEPVDTITVVRELRAREQLERVGGASYLVGLVDSTPHVGHVEAHAEIVARLHRQRALVGRLQQAQAEGYDRIESLDAFVDELARDARALAENATSRLPWLDTPQIFAPLAPIPYVLEALDLCPGAPALVAGFGFGGKTLACMALALAIASGRRAWGEFQVARGPVLWLDYEQGEHLTRLRFQRLALGMGITREDIEGHLRIISMPRFYLDAPGAADVLARDCEGARALFIDSFRAACPTVEENDSASRVPLDALGRMSGATGCAVGVIHHARKPSKENGGGGARMSMRGSGALYDAAGSVLVLEAEKGERPCVHHEKARSGGKLHEDFYLAIEDVDGEDVWGRTLAGAGLRVAFQCEEQVNPPRSPSARFSEIKAELVQVMRSKPGASLRFLRASVTGKNALIDEALEELEAAKVVVCANGARGAKEYRLAGVP